MELSYDRVTCTTLEELREFLKYKIQSNVMTFDKPIADLVAGNFVKAILKNDLYTWEVIYTGSMEHKLKQWMRDGLAKSAQLAPGRKWIHPWFDAKKQIIVDVMAEDAAYEFDINIAYLQDVTRWAEQVRDEYESYKAHEVNDDSHKA